MLLGRTCGLSIRQFDYGLSESKGWRRVMEDRTAVVPNMATELKTGDLQEYAADELTELSKTSFAAVFDGHAGHECAAYLSDELPRRIQQEMLEQRVAIRAAVEASQAGATGAETTQPNQSNNVTVEPMNVLLTSSSSGPDAEFTYPWAEHAPVMIPDQSEDEMSDVMKKVLQSSFVATDKDFLLQDTTEESAGSTAATVLLFGRRLFAANVGDSRVLLSRGGGQCIELTSDHILS
jgi:serine/threonine protein phosphatase PrpC